MGGYERNPMPWALDGIPADFNHRLLDPDWPRFSEIMAGAIRRVPAIADAPVTRMINGPEGVHARQRVHPRRVGRPRAVRRRRLLRARHRGRRRHRPPGRVVDRRGRTRARPVEDGHPPLRAAVPQPLVHARAEHRELRDLLRHPLPERGAPGRAPAARVAGLRSPGGARGVVRREGVVGAGELVRAERRWRGRGDGGRPRGAPAARLGRGALEPGDRRRGAGDADDGRPVRRDVVREDRDRGSGRGRADAVAVRQRRRPGRSAASPTPSC